MQSNYTGKTTIFRNEYNDKVFYSAAFSQKTQDGEWENTTKSIKFPKSVDLPNKTKIDIKKAWEKFYLKDKKPVFYIMCTEFEMLEQPAIPEGFYTDDRPGFNELSDDIPF